MLPEVSIIILNWNGKEDTKECIDSLKKINYSNYNIVLVDNNSYDGSVQFFKEIYPDIKIIENDKNLGYAEGNNIGIKKIIEEGSKYLLIINNDVIVDPNFLTELVKIIEYNNIVGVGPKIYHYYNNKIIDKPQTRVNMWTGNFRFFVNEKDNNNEDPKEVECISGCCMLFRTKLLEEIGAFDPEYFLYWEETDLCSRIIKAGYKLYYVPKAKIWHKIGSTSGSSLSYYYFGRNLFLFMKKNATGAQKVSFLFFFIIIGFWIQIMVILLKHKNVSSFISYIKGIKDGQIYFWDIA